MKKQTNKAMEKLEEKSWLNGKGCFYTVHTLNQFILVLFLDDNDVNHLVLSINIETDSLSSMMVERTCEHWYGARYRKYNKVG